MNSERAVILAVAVLVAASMALGYATFADAWNDFLDRIEMVFGKLAAKTSGRPRIGRLHQTALSLSPSGLAILRETLHLLIVTFDQKLETSEAPYFKLLRYEHWREIEQVHAALYAAAKSSFPGLGLLSVGAIDPESNTADAATRRQIRVALRPFQIRVIWQAWAPLVVIGNEIRLGNDPDGFPYGLFPPKPHWPEFIGAVRAVLAKLPYPECATKESNLAEGIGQEVTAWRKVEDALAMHGFFIEAYRASGPPCSSGHGIPAKCGTVH